MLQQNLNIKGYVSLVLTDENGNIKNIHKDNLVVGAGLAHVISRLKDNSSNVMSHIALGSSVTTTSVTQTALGNEVARSVATVSLATTNVSNDSLQYSATFGSGVATGILREAGVFNASSSGTMLSRVNFGDISKEAGDTLTITWKIVIS